MRQEHADRQRRFRHPVLLNSSMFVVIGRCMLRYFDRFIEKCSTKSHTTMARHYLCCDVPQIAPTLILRLTLTRGHACFPLQRSTAFCFLRTARSDSRELITAHLYQTPSCRRSTRSTLNALRGCTLVTGVPECCGFLRSSAGPRRPRRHRPGYFLALPSPSRAVVVSSRLRRSLRR